MEWKHILLIAAGTGLVGYVVYRKVTEPTPPTQEELYIQSLKTDPAALASHIDRVNKGEEPMIPGLAYGPEVRGNK